MISFFSVFLFCILLCSLPASNIISHLSLPQRDITDSATAATFCVFMKDLSGLTLGQTLLEFSLRLYIIRLAVEGRKLEVLFTIA